MEKKKIFELFRETEFFELFDDDEIREFIDLLKEESFSVGDTIFNEGEFGGKWYVIYKGEVRISKEVPGVGEETIVVLKQGSFFGEMALLNDYPRTANAIANTNCQLLYLDRDAFDELIFFHKDIAYKILLEIARMLAERLHNTTEQMYAYLSLINSF